MFGPKGCGKSCFINRLIKKGEIEISPETDRHICINKIRYCDINYSSKYPKNFNTHYKPRCLSVVNFLKIWLKSEQIPLYRYQAQQEKYFILQEVCASDQEEILERGGDCDLAIVLYDTSRQDSFSKAVEIQERLDVPSVFIGG